MKLFRMKKIKACVVHLIFLFLVYYSGYLYSLRSDYVPWGNSLNDGLFFIAFYIIILPLQIIASVAKWLLFKRDSNNFKKYIFFFYVLLISIPALDFEGSQKSLAFGIGISCIIFLSALIEFVYMLLNLKTT